MIKVIVLRFSTFSLEPTQRRAAPIASDTGCNLRKLQSTKVTKIIIFLSSDSNKQSHTIVGPYM